MVSGKKVLFYLLSFVFLLCCVKKSSAATYLWSGASGASWALSSSWINLSNPINGGYPGSGGSTGDIAEFISSNITVNLSSTLTIANLETIAYGVNGITISVASGSTLNINSGVITSQAAGNTPTVSFTFSGSGVTKIGGTTTAGYASSFAIASGATVYFTANAIFDEGTDGSNNNPQGSITNNGTLNILSGCTFKLGDNSFITNNGTIHSYSATFSLSGSGSSLCAVNNNGVFRDHGSTFNITGNGANFQNTGSSANFHGSGTTISFTTGNNVQTINNTNTFLADSGSVILLGTQACNITNSGSSANFTLTASTINTSTSTTGQFAYISNSSSSTFNANGGSVINMMSYQGYINNAGTFIAGTPGSSCIVNLSFQGNTLGNNTSIYNTGIFILGSSSAINATGTSASQPIIVYNKSGTFTLMSDANGSATIGALGSASSFQGQFNVQRYITGGAGYRGYRLMSSPVNISNNITGGGNLSLAYLNGPQTVNGTQYLGIYTAGQGSGFSATNINPIIYLYDESRTTNNSTFVAGKNVGIYDITGNTVTTLSGTTKTTGVSIPVGNSFLLYFLGNTSVGTLKSTSPPAATATAIGYINQGSIPVTFWNTSSTSIPYHTSAPGAGGLAGYNQVGNPYASTINLDQVAAENTAISPIFWEMNGAGSTYYSYNATSKATSNTKASKYIVSGQGFIIDATATGQTITFNEDQKVAYPAITATSTPALLLAVKPQSPSILSGLHLKLSKDTSTNTETGIYFSSAWSDAFSSREDALDLDGASPAVYLSSYSSDGKRLSINELNTIGKGKVVKLYVNTTANGQYSISLADIQNVDTVYNLYLRDHYKKDSLDIGRYHTYLFDVTKSDTNSFGSNRFDLSIHPRPLAAYRLNLFTAQKVTGGVKISWNTSNEGDYTGFVLQKMKNGVVQYLTLDSLQSDGRGDYYYIDNNPNTTGNNTYRLQQNDVYDNLSYSPSINVNYVSSGNSMAVYPNPARESIQLVMSSSNLSQSTSNVSTIYNSSGAVVGKKTIFGSTWSHDVSNLMPGVYTVQVIDNNGKLSGVTKFIKAQ